MPRSNVIQEQGPPDGVSPIVEASLADQVESVAGELRIRQERIWWAALLFHVGSGETNRALEWLNALATFWGESASRQEQPWGELTPLPQVVVDVDAEPPESRVQFMAWGISSFADHRDVGVIAREMAEVIAAAEESGALEPPPPLQELPDDGRIEQHWTHPEEYEEVLGALKELEKSHERED